MEMGGEGSVEVEQWSDGVLLYTLRRGSMHLKLTNWGATITSLCLPDARGGEVADVVLGFDHAKPYMDGTSPYFGCIVGRVANRIGGAKFSLQGHCYDLPANNGSNTLHGGFVGYDKVLWESREVNNPEGPSVQFTHHSFDGDQGFPGNLRVAVSYTLSKDFELRTEMEAVAETKATPVSLAQHSYWNLGGHNSGDILNHWIHIWASQITPVNDHQIPIGLLTPVHNTPFDFTEEAQIGSRMDEVPGGYDHNYVLDGKQTEDGLHLAARVRDPSSGRVLELLTNAPGMQFYTGNFLDAVLGKGGYVYRKHAGFCLETQGFPNAINQANFPSIVILPGQTYKHVMIHRFSFEEDMSNGAAVS